MRNRHVALLTHQPGDVRLARLIRGPQRPIEHPEKPERRQREGGKHEPGCAAHAGRRWAGAMGGANRHRNECSGGAARLALVTMTCATMRLVGDRTDKGARGRISRRRFVQGASGSALSLAGARAGLFPAEAPRRVLSGTQFDLEVASLPVRFGDRARVATAVNGQIPAPLLLWRQGDVIRVRVTNRLAVRTSIHWHGVLVPAAMDGVPGLSFGGIAPGATFTYEFRATQAGTYWYHSHSRFQEQTGLYGPIIIAPANGERHAVARDYTVLLSDWTDEDPEHIYATLKRDSEYFNFSRRTVGDFVRDARTHGLRDALAERRMWADARMDPTDLADVSGYTYTYLMNGVSPAGNWSGEFRRGERVKLRFINGSAMSFFDVRIPGLGMSVVV